MPKRIAAILATATLFIFSMVFLGTEIAAASHGWR